ncbi:hypothetical protein QJS10_CPB17g00425 [Acorus calamus]|uniref:Uncharacterized protein n=1 Tax=Acorus calamus TaxID=4465 RepID=A0AAV9CW15_ACOCL|nr:hypothetical protein QJS10_CPB17g00425 [Acorus calamus]
MRRKQVATHVVPTPQERKITPSNLDLMQPNPPLRNGSAAFKPPPRNPEKGGQPPYMNLIESTRPPQ